MRRCRVACVRYLNTVPLIEGLDKLDAIELIPTVPARIADLVLSGEADIGLCSIVDGAAGAEEPAGDLSLLSVGMIGCDGPTLTVRLFSTVSLDRVTTVHADSDSHTSTALCQVLLWRMHGIRAQVVAFDARERVPLDDARRGDGLEEAWPATVLLIGDKVVTDAPPPDRYAHQLDLGQAWKELTGLPFVYATWMCRAGEADSVHVRTASALLDRQRRRNQARMHWLIEKHAPEHRWPPALARRYLGELLRYDVGEREREAVGRFLGEAAELGLVRSAAARWVEDPVGAAQGASPA